jgi:hypothetical protein
VNTMLSGSHTHQMPWRGYVAENNASRRNSVGSNCRSNCLRLQCSNYLISLLVVVAGIIHEEETAVRGMYTKTLEEWYEACLYMQCNESEARQTIPNWSFLLR